MMINLYIIYYIWNMKQVIELTVNKIWKWWNIEQENKGTVLNMRNIEKKQQQQVEMKGFILEMKKKQSNKSNFVNVTSILIKIQLCFLSFCSNLILFISSPPSPSLLFPKFTLAMNKLFIGRDVNVFNTDSTYHFWFLFSFSLLYSGCCELWI